MIHCISTHSNEILWFAQASDLWYSGQITERYFGKFPFLGSGFGFTVTGRMVGPEGPINPWKAHLGSTSTLGKGETFLACAGVFTGITKGTFGPLGFTFLAQGNSFNLPRGISEQRPEFNQTFGL